MASKLKPVPITVRKVPREVAEWLRVQAAIQGKSREKFLREMFQGMYDRMVEKERREDGKQ